MSPATLIATPVLGTAIAVAVLRAEARRLPAQNIVALTIGSLGSATVIEACTTLFRPFNLTASLSAASLTTASLLASRPLARIPGPGPSHLFVRTVLAAAALTFSAGWPTGETGFLVAAIRTGASPLALLLLAPWWINKRLAPARTPDWAGFAGPTLLLGLATLALLDGSTAIAGIQTVAGSAMTFWAIRGLALKPSGTPSSAARSPTTPDPRSGS